MNEGIHWFSLDGGQVCVKKNAVFKKIRIRVDRVLMFNTIYVPCISKPTHHEFLKYFPFLLFFGFLLFLLVVFFYCLFSVFVMFFFLETLILELLCTLAST